MYTTYNIFDDMLKLRDVFDDFFQSGRTTGRSGNFPYINLYEEGDNIEIRAVLPGVESKDIDIQLTQDSIVIAGERKSDLKDKPYIRKERDFGEFKKSVKLPYNVDREKINASLKDGILKIVLTKSEDARPKKIAIK